MPDKTFLKVSQIAQMANFASNVFCWDDHSRADKFGGSRCAQNDLQRLDRINPQETVLVSVAVPLIP